MTGDTVEMSGLSPNNREQAIQTAADALRQGGLVVFPTETVYGVAAAAAAGLEHLHAAGLAPPHCWHTHSLEPIADLLLLEAPVNRRLLAKLLPGPVQVLLEQPPAVLAAVRERLGVGENVLDDGSALLIRCPDHPIAEDLLEAAGVSVVAARLGAASFAGPHADRSGEILSDHQNRPDAVLLDGPPREGTASTALRLRLNGSFAIEREGPIDERTILAALERLVVFVCTGNTCRSPMAEALANKIVAEQAPGGITTRFQSAGVAAMDGLPASPEAVHEMHDRGLDLSTHESAGVRADLLAEAEIVFTMTPSHAEAVMRTAPEHAHKIYPLDPAGVVPDPIGHPQEAYRETADRLETLIRARLRELDG